MPHIGHCVEEFLGRRLSPAQQSRAEEHLRDCAHCRLLVARARQCRDRLAAGTVPQASVDLAQRILERTRCLDTPGDEQLQLPYRVRRRAGRVLAAGSAAAVVAVLGSAYLAGGNAGSAGDAGSGSAAAAPMAAAALTNRWPAETPAAMAQLPASAQLAGSALPRRVPQSPDWLQADAPQATAVGTADIDRLKLAGWSCPELKAMGFSLSSAQGFVLAGVPTLELILGNGSNTVRIYEQRQPESRAAADAGGGASSGDAPVNAMTGHDASADGFQPLLSNGVQAWLHQGNPWQVVFRQNGATYTVSTDLSATALNRMTGAIASTGHPVEASAGGQQNGWADWFSRIVRGFARMVQW